MKKNLFSLALMAVTLVACNDDTPEPNEDKVPVAHVQRICHGEYYVNSNGASVLENCDFRFYDLQGLLEQEKHMRWVYPDCKMSLDELSALIPSTPWDGPSRSTGAGAMRTCETLPRWSRDASCA